MRWHAIRRLLRELVPHKAKIALVIFLGLVVSAVQPVSVRITQRIVDDLQHGLSLEFLRSVPLLLILVFIVSGLAKYFHNTLRRTVAEQVILKLRTALFEKYLHMPLANIDRRRTGEMLASIQNDLAQMGQGMDTLSDMLKEPFTFLGLIGVAIYCDWRLTLVTLVVAPVVAQLFSRSGAAVKRYSARNLAHFSDLMSLGQEALVGSRVVKVFRLEPVLHRKFEAIQEQYFKTIRKSISVQELATPAVELIGALLIAGVILYGSYRVSHGYMTTGQLIAFIIAIGLCQMPLKQLNNAFLKMKGAEAAAERVFGVLDVPDDACQPSGRRRASGLRDRIAYEAVSLAYDEKLALDRVSFEIRRGECIALVGQSGSGKTSLVNLLPRLYDPTGGRITIDGVDIRELELGELRGLISFVTQETFLFNDSILENIRYGKPEASRREIERAAELAHCSDFIARCPQGFDTRIGDRGVCLSGGERQRVAIARAILKGAPILVLDEATSSLDSHSEQVVQEAIDTLMAGRTTLLVAHRFSTVRRASRIYVMERGRIRETGTHDELVGMRGIYSGLFERQVSLS